MARIRSLKPEFCSSPAIAILSIPCRLHFAMLWTHADDEGRGTDNALLIKAALWPLDEAVGPEEVEGWQAELAAHGRIVRYEIEGRRFFQIVNFMEHQRPSRPKPSRIPAPPVNGHRHVTDTAVTHPEPVPAVDNSPISHSETVQVKANTDASVIDPRSAVAVVGAGAGAGEMEREQEQEPRAAPRNVFDGAIGLLLLRLDKPGVAATKTNPTAWLDSARRGLRSEHHDAAVALMKENPAITAEELADALIPEVPGPPSPPYHQAYTPDRDQEK